MTLILTVLHVLVCISLVFVVLLQKGSGADMGAAFGGSSQSLFGARGSGDFLSKLTAGLATIFMLTSLTLAFFSTRTSDGVSVMEKAPVASQSQTTPGAAPVKGQEKVKEPESGPPVPAKSAPAKNSTGGAATDGASPPVQAKPVPLPPSSDSMTPPTPAVKPPQSSPPSAPKDSAEKTASPTP